MPQPKPKLLRGVTSLESKIARASTQLAAPPDLSGAPAAAATLSVAAESAAAPPTAAAAVPLGEPRVAWAEASPELGVDGTGKGMNRVGSRASVSSGSRVSLSPQQRSGAPPGGGKCSSTASIGASKPVTKALRGPIRGATALEGQIAAATALLSSIAPISENDSEEVKASKLRQQQHRDEQSRMRSRLAVERAEGKDGRRERSIISYVPPKKRSVVPFDLDAKPTTAEAPAAAGATAKGKAGGKGKAKGGSKPAAAGNAKGKSTKLASMQYRRKGETNKGLRGWVNELDSRGWTEKKQFKAAGLQAWLENYADAKNEERLREIVAGSKQRDELRQMLVACNIWWRVAKQRREAEEDEREPKEVCPSAAMPACCQRCWHCLACSLHACYRLCSSL